MIDISMIKVEPMDDEEEIGDSIVESYDIDLVNNVTYKLCIVSGLQIMRRQVKQLDVSIRTDRKELKIIKRMGVDQKLIGYTKAVCENMNQQDYAVRFDKEARKMYMIPINSKHTITFLDHENASMRTVDLPNSIVEDGFKMPYPSRNRHEKLVIEMKNNLFKPLQSVIKPEHAKIFLNGLLFPIQRKPFNFDFANNKKMEVEPDAKEVMDFQRCHHWKLARVNLSDIRKIQIEDFKIEIFLRKAQVATFDEMLALLDVQPEKLLSVLIVIAHLVAGNWVVKSELLYYFNDHMESESKKQHFKDLIEAREHLLWLLFTKNSLVFDEIYPLYNKSPDHLEIINRLTKPSTKRPGERVFILGDDDQFLNKYSAATTKHQKKTEATLIKYKNYS